MKTLTTPQIKHLVICAAIISLIGCAKTESDNVRVKGIHASIGVVAEGNGNTTVNTTLKVGSGLGGTTLELSSSDTLLAYANGVTRVMRDNSSFLGASYTTTFPFDDEGTEFRVEFNRSEGTSAPNSVVTLPAPFSITSTPGITYAKNAIVSVTWEPAYTTDDMLVDYWITCPGSNGNSYLATYTVGAVDNGQRDITVSEILSKASPGIRDSSRGCTLEIKVIRRRLGELDPHYGEGGSISAAQKRKISVNIAP